MRLSGIYNVEYVYSYPFNVYSEDIWISSKYNDKLQSSPDETQLRGRGGD